MHISQKQRAPAPPGGNSIAQTIYGTLPHAPRNSQNLDAIDYRMAGLGGSASGSGGAGGHAGKSQPDVYSTLPHLRNISDGSSGSGVNKSSYAYHHYDNKSYERFEPLITASQQAKYDKHKLDQANETPVLTTFGHKRSPSGESLSRNLHLAGAKLVLPTGGEMPTLKPVDKSLVRPKLPPPGPPAVGTMLPGIGNIGGGGVAGSSTQNNGSSAVSNGQSSESINSLGDGPVAPPRKVSDDSEGA